jgi:TolB-like protein
MTATRRLAAILAADVAGYSRLIGADEEGTLNRLRSIRAEIIDPTIIEHRGRIVKTTGDGLLVEFSSVVDALRCATEWQRGMDERSATESGDDRIEFRIGVHQGDIVVEQDDILGDGVNVAARLEGLAESGGICVSARVQEDVAGRLDLTFEDIGEQNLKNIARPVHVYRVRPATKAQRSPFRSALPLPDKPSIAVLPFQNMSGDPDQDYFADGMVEEIITALSRIRWLFVIARNSSFTYKDQSVDVKRVGRELGIRYVLEGSVRKAGRRIRITGQLIDAQSGANLWADRFDASLADVFELQDQVAKSVAGVIEPALQAAETALSARRPTNDLTAYDLYLRASPNAFSWERDRVLRAQELLSQALDRDPDYGPALALEAWCYLLLDVNDWTEDRGTNRRDGIALARRALQVGAEEPNVMANAAFVLGYFGEDIDAAKRLVNRALSLNPSFAFGWLLSGFLNLWAGETDLATEHLEISLRLNPRDRRAFHLTGLGIAQCFNRRFEEAIENLLVSLEELPSYVATYRFLASCYAHLGRLDEAREVVGRLRTLTPVVVPAATFYRNREQRELYLSGLRLAAGKVT